MAHITLIKPMVEVEDVSGWNPKFKLERNPIIIAREDIRAAGSVTLLNVRVFAYMNVPIPAPWCDDVNNEHLFFDAILLEDAEADRIEALVPLGYTFTTVWHKNRMYRALHMDPLHLATLADYSRVMKLMERAEAREEGDIEQLSLGGTYTQFRFYDRADEIIDYRNNIRHAMATDDGAARRQYMRLVLDIRDDADCEITIPASSRSGVSPNYSYGQRTKECHVSPAVLHDSEYPSLGSQFLVSRYGHHATLETLQAQARRYRLGYTEGGTVKVPGLDDNVMGGQVGFFRRALRTDKASISNKGRDKKKISGRWMVLDEDPVQFPLATRCSLLSYSASPVLAFKINRHTGAYGAIPRMLPYVDEFDRQVDQSHPSFWTNSDYMLVHRAEDLWRFVFVCHFSAGIRLGDHVQMVAIIPYTVEDSECSRTPRLLAPQRGMPRDIAKAIHNAPYCASAISHATSRLKYLSSHLPMLRDEYQRGDFTAHYPELPILFRSKKSFGPDITGTHTTKRSAVTKCINERRFYANDLLAEELRMLPPTDITWGETKGVATTSVLGWEAANARALCLDE